MTRSSSPPYPSSFDPALHLHSEEPQLEDASLALSYSDDLQAFHAVAKEIKAEKTRQGIVIQHRAWNLTEIFRSEGDISIDTPLKNRSTRRAPISGYKSPISSPVPLSSPPPKMAFISSPVAYPASSSPAILTPRKRRKVDGSRSPLQDVDANTSKRVVGGFLVDESDEDDDDDDFAAIRAAHNKRKATSTIDNGGPQGIISMSPLFSKLNRTDTATEEEGQNDIAENVESQPQTLIFSQPLETFESRSKKPVTMTTASGKSFQITERRTAATMSYEQLIASRSSVAPGRARKSYYGIDIHQLMDEAALEINEAAKAKETVAEIPTPSIEQSHHTSPDGCGGKTLMWTEKYRAKKFTDLVGDERTHRSVLRWLKSWDPIVFPGSSKPRPKSTKNGQFQDDEQRHRKVLMLTGPPGLGKTTLAHVCAKQAGYEVQEINASDERSKDVVKGRIREMVGTENVKGVETKTATGKVRKAGRPVCVVIDEVDGVVTGSGGSGEGGFIKALIDLINLDQKNSAGTSSAGTTTKKKKGDKFRLLRPIILICNDVYHPSLRPLRQSSMAEIIHIRKPPLSMVISRMHSIFEKEGIACDNDGVRRLCEATWGVATKKEGGRGSGTGEGDIRGIMVVSEWVARKLKASLDSTPGTVRLSRKWVEENILNDLAHGGGAARGLGRGGAKEVVERVFMENAGFPKTGDSIQSNTSLLDTGGSIGVAEAGKRRAMDRLREMIATCGDVDRVVTDSFTTYPSQTYQDDNFLSKPNTAYEWLHFHDTLSSALHGSQEWELAPYLSQSTLAFHYLFASSTRPSYANNGTTINPNTTGLETEPAPFSGPSAPYTAAEAQKANRAALTSLHATLSLPITRMFRSPAEIATELLPYTLRMLSPDVKPVIINTNSGSGDNRSRSTAASVRRASERVLVARAVTAMAATGVRFEKTRVEFGESSAPAGRMGSASFIYRMEPALDVLGNFETLGKKGGDTVRYAVRQVLETEWKKESVRLETEARNRRGGVATDISNGGKHEEDQLPDLSAAKSVKKDFFGRVITEISAPGNAEAKNPKKTKSEESEGRVWVSFNEGFSNAVRKPVTIEELMRGL